MYFVRANASRCPGRNAMQVLGCASFCPVENKLERAMNPSTYNPATVYGLCDRLQIPMSLVA